MTNPEGFRQFSTACFYQWRDKREKSLMAVLTHLLTGFCFGSELWIFHKLPLVSHPFLVVNNWLNTANTDHRSPFPFQTILWHCIWGNRWFSKVTDHRKYSFECGILFYLIEILSTFRNKNYYLRKTKPSIWRTEAYTGHQPTGWERLWRYLITFRPLFILWSVYSLAELRGWTERFWSVITF